MHCVKSVRSQAIARSQGWDQNSTLFSLRPSRFWETSENHANSATLRHVRSNLNRMTIPWSTFLILCQVNNSLQGRGKWKYVPQISIHFLCLKRRNTKYSRWDSQEGGRGLGFTRLSTLFILLRFSSFAKCDLNIGQSIADHPLREKTPQMFPSTIHRKKFKTQLSLSSLPPGEG